MEDFIEMIGGLDYNYNVSSYEKNKALLYVYSGAGGVDSHDLASILLTIY